MKLIKWLSKIFSNLTFWHIIFWLLSFMLFTSSFFIPYFREGKVQWDYLKIGFIYNFYLVGIVYINYLILIPKLVAARKVALYIFTLIALTLTFGILFTLTFNWVMGVRVNTMTTLAFIVSEFIYIIITSFFKFFKDWVLNIGLKVQLLEIEKQKVEAELDTLKSQLNPHFLFNVLNIIYSHSLLKSDAAPSIVIKLSDLMSYILYDCKTKTVPIQKEIDFLKNYIELEKVRLEKDIEVQWRTNNIGDLMIPPLLFFPLIENAFKHGIGSYPEDKKIGLSFTLERNRLFFLIRNAKGRIQNEFQKKKKGGIGIENVRKRLDLLYPDKHSMKVLDKEDSFEVEITIENVDVVN